MKRARLPVPGRKIVREIKNRNNERFNERSNYTNIFVIQIYLFTEELVAF